MSNIIDGKAGERLLITGNAAIARGAIEAGISVVAAYPGTPATEIVENLGKGAETHNMYVEWSANEQVAAEVAAAASLSGLRSLTSMKNAGMNVAADALLHIGIAGTRGGMVIVPCDDPGCSSSSTEMETRLYARMFELPLIEPSDGQEAKDMVKYAVELSEELFKPVILRGVTHLSHVSSIVELSEPLNLNRKANFECDGDLLNQKSGLVTCIPMLPKHQRHQEKLRAATNRFEESLFNAYIGPNDPELMIITSSICTSFSLEAVRTLGVKDRVGILKLGTTWPLPPKLLEKYLKMAPRVFVVEEVLPVMENDIKALAMDLADKIGIKKFHGKADGSLPTVNDLTPDLVVKALSGILKIPYGEVVPSSYIQLAKRVANENVVDRGMSFCPGCPHRATFWLVNHALKMDNNDGFVCSDVGCYNIDLLPGGFQSSKTGLHMGSGMGLATGFAKLDKFGMDRTILASSGDSTFFHAVMPALVNAVHNKANVTLLVLDNSGTAMTGFQAHPGVAYGASSEKLPSVDIFSVCKGMGATVKVIDPFEPEDAMQSLLESIENKDGVNVLIFKQGCTLSPEKKGKKIFDMRVDESLCLGENCGCDRLCTRVFRCPGLSWDTAKGKSKIEDSMCIGCGFCTFICPQRAILKTRKEAA
jgi:indolepyruvate ferredoxin oxidoreductase, alpha subunit